MRTTTRFQGLVLILLSAFIISFCRVHDAGEETSRPNILFVIADDQSFPHASAYGTKGFQTPAFDKVAKKGILFNNAFVAAPQCSPSRAAILTGRNVWQLEEAGTHSSYFPDKFPVFTQALAGSGYAVGYTGKAWGPGNWKDAGWKQNPVGTEYNQVLFDKVPYAGLSKVDYASNFHSFLKEKADGQPFFFWFGAQEPHREYEFGSGGKALEMTDITVPPFLAEDDSIVNDLLDYALEISWFDRQLEKMISLLEERGELENTIIVVTADNGMPFPHAKASLQEFGIHVPLAVCGPSIPGNRKEDALVSLIDLAPTFLELAGLSPMEGVTGRSLVPILRNDSRATQEFTRTFVLSGRERHTHARPDNAGYPARAIRTPDYLYIRNFKPDRWPMGDPPPENPGDDAGSPDEKPITQGYEDIDDSPSKRVMISKREKWPALFQVAFAKRGEEQLFDVRKDPYCLKDLSSEEGYAGAIKKLRVQLDEKLREQGDPRVQANGDVFDTYPRFGRMRAWPGFRERGEYNKTFNSAGKAQ